MRVLFLTHSFPRHDTDAAGSFVWRLAKALRDEDVGVRVVAPAGQGLTAADEIGGIHVERFRYAPRRYETLAYTGTMAQDVATSWSARFAMVSFLGADFGAAVRARREYEPDVVHAHWWFPGGLVGSWIGSLASIPLVTTLHGSDVRIARNTAVMKPLARRVLQQSTIVTTVSHWLAHESASIAPGITPTVAPMPVDTGRFAAGANRDHNRLLLVGRLNAQKGIEYAIRAVAAMRTPVTLEIVGDGPARADYVALATELGVRDRVAFLGHLPSDALPELYRCATALVVPSIEEGLGLVAVEAQLSETPVVGFASGGLLDVIQHDRTGLLVPPRNVEALAAALDDVVADRDRAAALGSAGRMYALSRFSPESAARTYAELYREAIRRRAA